jgi:hypothetical protein
MKGIFKFVQIKGQVLFKGEIIMQNVLGPLKVFFSRTSWPEKLKKSYPTVCRFKFVKIIYY